jgi:hypothetical protein
MKFSLITHLSSLIFKKSDLITVILFPTETGEILVVIHWMIGVSAQ